jgi:hypothetical protein
MKEAEMTTNTNDYQTAEVVVVGKAESMILGEKYLYMVDTMWISPMFLRTNDAVWYGDSESAD